MLQYNTHHTHNTYELLGRAERRESTPQYKQDVVCVFGCVHVCMYVCVRVRGHVLVGRGHKHSVKNHYCT